VISRPFVSKRSPRSRLGDTRARQLAEDLVRWLEGEPVEARRPNAPERLWHWARRNARVAALGATILTLLVVLAAGATFAAWRINAARLNADRSANAAQRAESLASERARIAGEQRELALDTVKMLVEQVQEDLGRAPWTLNLRRKLSDAAIERLDKIARAEGTDADTLLARIVAHDRIGDLALLSGRTADARRSFEAARDQAEALITAAPGGAASLVEPRRHLARALDKLGDLATMARDMKEASSNYERAKAIRDSIPAPFHKSPIEFREQAVSMQKLGDLKMLAGDPEAARSEYAKALA
jgi:predicted negative regulator of RcsB-dependent stress response